MSGDPYDLVIISHQDDAHATAVLYAAKKLGKRATILSPKDICKWTSYSWSPGCNTLARNTELIFARKIWLRRMGAAVPTEAAHPEDTSFIVTSSSRFFRNICDTNLLVGDWYNEYWASQRANNKLLQLKTAQRVGLEIPRTIISNNPDDIRRFFNTYSEHGVIAKPLHMDGWRENGSVYVPYTSEITEADLAEDDPLRLAPMIYQSRVQKSFELRVLVIDDKICSARLNSQEIETATLDWRQDIGFNMVVEPHNLPTNISQKILAFQEMLNLRFGVFDLAVTSTGDTIFFEVNEMGQYLWVEDLCPDIPMLALTAKQLLNTENTLQYKDFEKSGYHEEHLEALKSQYEPGFAG